MEIYSRKLRVTKISPSAKGNNRILFIRLVNFLLPVCEHVCGSVFQVSEELIVTMADVLNLPIDLISYKFYGLLFQPRGNKGVYSAPSRPVIPWQSCHPLREAISAQ